VVRLFFLYQTGKRRTAMFGTPKEVNNMSVKIRFGFFLVVFFTSFWIQAEAQIHSDATGNKESAHIK